MIFVIGSQPRKGREKVCMYIKRDKCILNVVENDLAVLMHQLVQGTPPLLHGNLCLVQTRMAELLKC